MEDEPASYECYTVVDRSSFFRSGATGKNEFSTLAGLLGPATVTPAPVDWADVEEQLEVVLPADYRSFVDTYGPGTFCDIAIAAPGAPGKLALSGFLNRKYEQIRAASFGEHVPLFPERGGLISWGETVDGWTLGWASTGPDPDRWGTVTVDMTRSHALGVVGHAMHQSFSAFLIEYAQPVDELGPIAGRKPWSEGPRFVPYRG
jgi:hypothetical protein